MNTIKKKVELFFVAQDNDAENPRNWDGYLGIMATQHRRYTLGGKGDKVNEGMPDTREQWLWDNFQAEISAQEGFDKLFYAEDDEIRRQTDEAEQAEYTALQETYAELTNAQEERLEALRHRVMFDEATEDQKLVFTNFIKTWEKANYRELPLFLYDHGGITMRTSSFSDQWDSGQVGIIYTTKARAEELGAPWDTVVDQLTSEVETFDQYLTGDVWGYTRYVMQEGWLEEEEVDTSSWEVLVETPHYVAYKLEKSPYEFEYDDYFTDDEDSCWGFFGSDYMDSELQGMAENGAKKAERAYRELLEKRRRQYWCM